MASRPLSLHRNKNIAQIERLDRPTIAIYRPTTYRKQDGTVEEHEFTATETKEILEYLMQSIISKLIQR